MTPPQKNTMQLGNEGGKAPAQSLPSQSIQGIRRFAGKARGKLLPFSIADEAGPTRPA
jgi:hypothetical protein